MRQHRSSFSWSRVGMVAKYYYPALRLQMMWYPIVTAGLFLIVSLLQLAGGEVADASMGIMGAISFMFYWAPLALCRHESRLTTTLLPVTAAEKTLVLLVYFFVVIPILLFGVEYALAGIVHYTMPEISFLDRALAKYEELELEDKGLLMVSTVFLSVLPAMLCLWGVAHFRQNRTLKAMLTSCGVYLATSFVAGISGVILAFKKGFEDGMAGVAPATAEETFARAMVETMTDVFVVVGIVAMAASVVMAYLTHREIKNYQI